MTFTLKFKDIDEKRDIPKKENYTIKDLLNDLELSSTNYCSKTERGLGY